MRELSRLLSSMPPSPTAAMMQKGRELSLAGHDVINLAGGDPDFDTPAHIQEAAFDAIRSGDTHYPTSHGSPELLEAICAKLEWENGVEATPDRVIATPGGKWALYVVLMSILNPGDEVLILDPVWVSYDPMVRLTGGVPVHVSLDHGDDFAVHKSALEAAVTDKTKLVMLNSPNNPTGYVMSMASMQAVAEVCRDHDLYLLSDEIYEHILYDGHTHVSSATLPDMAERTFIVNGFSKAYAMTGWRLAWIWGPPDAIRIGRSYMTNSVTSAASFTMAAGVAALNGPQECVSEMTAAYTRRRAFLLDALDELEGVEAFAPQGAFYLFMRFPHTRRSSLELTDFLLDELHLATTPGSAFGEAGEQHIRISFAAADDQLHGFVDRLARLAPDF